MILSIDTSTSVCAIALHQEGNLLAHISIHTNKATASALQAIIDQILIINGIQKSDLSAIAVGKGPGSYTGLRIAVSTAKGLCYGLNTPLIGINSLDAMASQVMQKLAPKDVLLLPMIDARRMEVYTATYTTSLQCITSTNAHIFTEHSFQDLLNEGKKLWLFGNGAPKALSLLQHENICIFQGDADCAHGIGIEAWKRYQAEDFEDLAYFEPFYLKEFQGNKVKGHKLLRNLKASLKKQ